MSYNSNGLILAPDSNYPSTGDIQRALGDTTGTGDLGTLCTHPNINRFAKYKPVGVAGYEQPNDPTFGLHAVATTSKTSLYSMSKAWTYDGAVAPYYRQLDFDRYFNGAPCPFMQANGTTLTVDLVNENTAPALFYMMMSGGALANRAFSAEAGIGSTIAVPTNYEQYCICIEDLSFDAGSGTFVSAMGGKLGLVIYDTSGAYQAEVWSTVAIADHSSIRNEMFKIPMGDVVLPMGDYKAVACAEVTSDMLTYYLPVYDDASYPAVFDLSVGGLDLYSQAAYGVAATAVTSSDDSLTTTSKDVYVTMRFWNLSGRTLDIACGNNQKFTLSCHISGSAVINGSSQDINRTYSTTTMAYPSSGTLSIAAGSYAELVYEIPNIFSPSGSSGGIRVESGEVGLTPRLYYYGTTEYTANLHKAITVTYG